jgi:hypothetical protein
MVTRSEKLEVADQQRSPKKSSETLRIEHAVLKPRHELINRKDKLPQV